MQLCGIQLNVFNFNLNKLKESIIQSYLIVFYWFLKGCKLQQYLIIVDKNLNHHITSVFVVFTTSKTCHNQATYSRPARKLYIELNSKNHRDFSRKLTPLKFFIWLTKISYGLCHNSTIQTAAYFHIFFFLILVYLLI